MKFSRVYDDEAVVEDVQPGIAITGVNIHFVDLVLLLMKFYAASIVAGFFVSVAVGIIVGCILIGLIVAGVSLPKVF